MSRRRTRALQARVDELWEQLLEERAARHAAEVKAAHAVGRLDGYRTALASPVLDAVRASARDGRSFEAVSA